MACCRHTGPNPRDVRTRLQDSVDNEVVQTGRASSVVSPGQTPPRLSSGPVQGSSNGTALAARRPTPGGSNVVVVTVSESPTTQPTTRPTVLETETENQSDKKRLRVLASRPDQTRADVNACTCRTIVLATGPEDRDGWTQQGVDWNKNRPGAKNGNLGNLFESQKVSRRLELRDRRSSTSGGWTMRRDLDAVRSRVDATQVNTYDGEDVVQATPPIKASRIILSPAATKPNAKDQHHSQGVGWRRMKNGTENDKQTHIGK